MSNTDTFIGNYRVISQLFSDPFSRVYLAEHSYTTKRPVAIRLWHTVHFSSTQEYSAFLQEAQALAGLAHPFVLSIIDLGVEVDSPYVVTEYIYTAMGSLRDRIRQHGQRPFQHQEALTMLSDAAQGLYQAHQQNLLHRQLAPEHIIFNGRGEAILADFGLQSILATHAMKKVNRLDSDPYAAPEVTHAVITRKSDQYALAAIAYELLTGYAPTQPPVPPTKINVSLPANIEHALLKGMAFEETDRYPDVGAFMVALFASDEAVEIAAPDTAETQRSALPIAPQGTAATPPLGMPALTTEEHTLRAEPYAVSLPQVAPTPVLPPLEHETLVAPAAESGFFPDEPPFQSVPALGSMQSGPSWASANPVLSSSYGAPGTIYGAIPLGGMQASRTTPPNRGRRNLLIGFLLVVVMLAVLLAVLGPYLYSILPASSATVKLTPMTKALTQTYTVNAVTGAADPAQHQGQLRTISYSTPAKTGAARATGTGQGGPTQATGTLVFSQFSIAASFSANLRIVSNSNVTIITDTSFSAQAGASVSVPSHASDTGTVGNIVPLDINNTYDFTDASGAAGTVVIQNTAAFTGGAASSTYTAVSQNDIDGLANTFVTQLTTDAKVQAQKLVQTGEKLTAPFVCTPNVQSDHKAGDPASTVNVSVKVMCTAEAYSSVALGQVASDWLKSDATAKFGGSYVLNGAITAGDAMLVKANSDGSAVFSIAAKALFAYQFTTDQERQFAQALVGKTQSDGLALLRKQVGVRDVSVSTGGFGGAFPSSLDAIKFVEASV